MLKMRLKPILYVVFATIVSTLSYPIYASDYGTTGLIDIPSARMASDATLTTTAAIQSATSAYSISYQVTPWLEGTFRYTGFNEFFYYDRNYEAKLRLWSEGDHIPQVAIGIRDAVGTGVFGAEYLVASKAYGNFDLTLGMGWGRLAGKGVFDNPMAQLSDSFEIRESDVGRGGELSSGLFFSGEKVGLFGGVTYQMESLPLTAILEYNPDQYDWEVQYGGRSPKSPWSAALKWQALPGISLSFSRQHNQEWGLTLAAALGSSSKPPRRPGPAFKSSLDMAQDELPPGIDKNSWYDRLLYDAERSELFLLAGSVDAGGRTATIVMGNKNLPIWSDAVARMTTLADLHLPRSVRTFNFVIEEMGHRVQTVQVQRPSNFKSTVSQLAQQQVTVLPAKQVDNPQHKTSFVQKKVFVDVNLSTKLQLFDPDDPARYQVYAKMGVSLALPDDWSLKGSYAVDIYNTFDTITRESDSILPRVRSDIANYLKQGETGIESLFLEKRGSYSDAIHYRWFGGVLEEMYSGAGAEVLYQPFQSRLAYGISANWVRQRDYDKSFNHLDYQTTTAFASVYWATPFYDFDIAVHAGQYLAKDVGATLEVRRTFSNGWMVGLWGTLTDVPFEDFGEGSFDKGMFFRIPFDGLFGRNTRGSYATRIRPIQRDGGARLEDFSGNIWWDIRNARYDSFYNDSARNLP